MIIPVRCFTCGSVVASKWEQYVKYLKEGKTQHEALNLLLIKRYCCRTMLLTHIDLMEHKLRMNVPNRA